MIFETNASSRAQQSGNTEDVFTFGGISFEIRTKGANASVSSQVKERAALGIHPNAIAHVVCTTSFDATKKREQDRRIRWTWNDAHCVVNAGEITAHLHYRGNGIYESSAVLPCRQDAMGDFLEAVGASVLDQEGGIIFHAAGVATLDGAVLFVGPSGAGKTTAASLMTQAKVCAFDRAVIFPKQKKWYVSTLATRSEDRTRELGTNAQIFPLAGIFRVLQGNKSPSVAKLNGANAYLALRESILCGNQSQAYEKDRFDRLMPLCESVFIGTVTTVLGVALDSTVQKVVAALRSEGRVG